MADDQHIDDGRAFGGAPGPGGPDDAAPTRGSTDPSGEALLDAGRAAHRCDERALIDAARQAAREAAGWLDAIQEPVADPGIRSAVSSLPAALRASYEILRELHRGGQGVVYLAVQRATKRKVAVKVLRGGAIASPRDRYRFEREVEVLGQLNHPGIVAIHDSGAADACQWFVMDYIAGRPLDAHLVPGGSTSAREVDEALRVFIRICEAVNAAHLRGIVHRDLKPGNILVDGDGHPHVLDFGLAKTTGDPFISADADGTPRPVTVTGQFLGSLPWASPEQAEGSPDDIDQRSDVYSLGVLLYQVLTGSFPYEVVGNVRDVLDNIVRAQPARPSTICRRVNGEIETIVLKALHKDRERRYQSAGELARDLQRYLAGEPVEAKRDSGWYVLRKTMRRYRVQSAVAIAFIALAIGAGVVSSVLWRHARREADRANAALAARDAAIGFLLEDVIGSVDPREGRGQSVTMAEALDDAGAAIDRRFEDAPGTAIDVHEMIGRAYLSLGLGQRARPHLDTALRLHDAHGGSPERRAELLESLGAATLGAGDAERAESIHRSALEIRIARFGPDSAEAARSMTHVASSLARQGRHEEAEALDRQALTILEAQQPSDLLLVARSQNQLAIRLRNLRRLDEAEELYRRCVHALEQVRGVRHLDTAVALDNWANCLMHLGRHQEAEPLLEQAIGIKRAVLAGSDPRLASSLQFMAQMFVYQREDGARGALFAREALQIREAALGEFHPRTCDSMHVLGRALLLDGAPVEAEAILRRALAGRVRRFSPASREVAESKAELGAALAARGEPGEARPLLVEAVESLEASLGPDDPATRRARAQLEALDGRT